MTKEEILNEELSDKFLEIIEEKDLPEVLRCFKRYIFDAMESYANQQLIEMKKNILKMFTNLNIK